MKQNASLLKKIELPRTPAEWLEAVMNFLFFHCQDAAEEEEEVHNRCPAPPPSGWKL